MSEDTNILTLLDVDKLEVFSNDLVNCLEKFKDNEDNKWGVLDYSFDLSKGKVSNLNAPNTFFQFDLERDTELHNFLKSIFSQELDRKEEDAVNEYINKIAEYTIENNLDSIQGIIRTVVIQDAPKEAAPLNDIRVCSVEMVDYSSIDEDDKYLLKMNKRPEATVNFPGIRDYVMENKGDKDSVEFIKEQIEQGNEEFQGILSVEKGDKFAWEVSLDLVVDYSFSDQFIAENTL